MGVFTYHYGYLFTLMNSYAAHVVIILTALYIAVFWPWTTQPNSTEPPGLPDIISFVSNTFQ